jgi:hypothetical protein
VLEAVQVRVLFILIRSVSAAVIAETDFLIVEWVSNLSGSAAVRLATLPNL